MKSPLAALSKYDFFGVLLLRIGLGALVAFHGYPILFGGDTVWVEIGSGAALTGLNENLYWIAGLISGITQFLGGILLAIGLFTRGSALCLTVVVGFAVANHIHGHSFGLSLLAHLQLALTLFSLVFIGPGRFSLDRKGI